MNYKETIEKRASLLKEMENLLHEATAVDGEEAKRSLIEQYDRVSKEAEALSVQADIAKRQELLAVTAVKPGETSDKRSNIWTANKKDHDLAFRSNICRIVGDADGYDSFAPYAAKVGNIYNSDSFRAQTVGTNSEGGYLATTEMANYIEMAKKYYGNLDAVARVINTTKGHQILLPTFDNTSGASGVAVHTENGSVSNADKAFGQVALSTAALATANFPISMELIRDAEFNILDLVGTAIGEDIGRKENALFTTGSSTAHAGLVTGSSAGKTCASATAFTWKEILDLVASIDYAYQQSPKFGLMMHFATYSKLLQLEDTTGRPLYLTSITEGGNLKLGGWNIIINNDMASSLTAGTKLVVAGDFSKFVIRRVGGVSVKMLNERYADQLAVGFVAHSTSGCKVVNSDAIKHMKLAAS